MMKKICMRTVLCLAALLSVCFASINPTLQLYNYTLSEYPAAPGHTVTLTLHVRNIEFANCAERVSVQLMTAYPLSVQGIDTKYLPDLCLNDPQDKGTVSFEIPVDSLAQPGTFPITVITNYEKDFDKFSTTNTINVRVSGEPALTASVVSSSPADIYPGDQATVTINILNNGTGRIESGHATLSAPAGIDVKWAGKDQDVGQLPARSSASLSFNIEAMKDTKPGNYTLTLHLQYTGENADSASQTFTFDMPIKDKADFIASAKDSAPLNADSDGEISVILRNTGTQEAKRIKARLQPIFPFSSDGTVRYIESLKPGEEKELVYMIHVDKDATPGQQISSLMIDYEDPQGEKLSDSEDFALTVVTKTFYQQLMDYWYIFGIIILVILFVAIRAIYKVASKVWHEAGEKK